MRIVPPQRDDVCVGEINRCNTRLLTAPLAKRNELFVRGALENRPQHILLTRARRRDGCMTVSLHHLYSPLTVLTIRRKISSSDIVNRQFG